MIKVIVYRDPSGPVSGFQLSGHSGYAISGADIVCSAVSALAENTVNAIEAFTEDKPEILSVNEEEGFLHYRLKTVSERSALLLDALVLGLKNIEKDYGKFIQIRFEEVRSC